MRNSPNPPPRKRKPGRRTARRKKLPLPGRRRFTAWITQQGQQAWLNQLCSVSTQTGCIVYQNVIAPNLWASFEQAQTVTTVEVTIQEKVDEQVADTRGDALMQIWRLQIELSDPWPMQETPQTVFSALALVIQEQGEWKFERFLTEEELSAFSTVGG